MKDTNIISLIVAPKEVDEKPASLDDTVDNGDDPLLASGQRMSEALAEGNKVIIKKRSGQYPHNTMGGSPQIGRRVTIRIKRPTSPMTGRDKRTSYDNAVENSKEFDYIAAVGTVFEGEKGLEYNLDDMVRVDPLDIRDFVKDHRGSKVIATVPSQAVFPRYVKIPPVSKDKIIQIVRYEAEQNVPFPIEEVLWGYKLIDNGGEDRLDGLGLMLAAAKKDNILPFFEGLRLQGVAEPNDAIGHLYKQRITPDDKDVIVLTTDERATTFTVVNYEGTRFSRSIPIPGYLDEKSNKETIAQSLNGDERQALYDIELNSPEAKPLLESANKNAATNPAA